jgi:hypothetical protein
VLKDDLQQLASRRKDISQVKAPYVMGNIKSVAVSNRADRSFPARANREGIYGSFGWEEKRSSARARKAWPDLMRFSEVQHIAVGQEPSQVDLHSDSTCGFPLLLAEEAAALPERDTLVELTREVYLFLSCATGFLPAVKATASLGNPSSLHFV